MTKTLTEQFRQGTLKSGYYYCKYKSQEHIMYFDGVEEFSDRKLKIRFYPAGFTCVSPVPSYDEYKRLQEQLNEANEVIKFFANSQIGKKNKDGTCGFWICSGDVAFDNPWERINNKMKYTCYDPRPAKKWLKKWGVK